jgi:hypothetical protein
MGISRVNPQDRVAKDYVPHEMARVLGLRHVQTHPFVDLIPTGMEITLIYRLLQTWGYEDMVKTFPRLNGDKTSKQGIERDMINTALLTDWTHLQRAISTRLGCPTAERSSRCLATVWISWRWNWKRWNDPLGKLHAIMGTLSAKIWINEGDIDLLPSRELSKTSWNHL